MTLSALHRRESGNTAVMVLICFIVFLGMLALGLEAGVMYTARGQAQNAADAAAHSAVRQLQSCDSGQVERTAAGNAAIASMAANPVMGRGLALDTGADVQFGRWYPYSTGPEKSFKVTNANPNSVRVTVHMDQTRNGALKLGLGSLFGRDSVNVSAVATATRDRRIVGWSTPGTSRSKVIPFAGAAQSVGAVGSTVDFFLGSTQTGPGNWGLIDLGPNGFTTTQNNGGSVIADQIANGFDGELTLPAGGANTGGRTGQMAGPVQTAMETNIGEIVIIMLYTGTPTLSGTNLIYRITGFAPVRIDQVVTTGALDKRGIRGTVMPVVDSTATTSPDAIENCLISRLTITQ